MQPVSLSIEDYDAICDLWQAAGLEFKPQGRDTRDAVAAQLAQGIQQILGIWQDQHLIGVVVVTHDSRKGWINRLAVHPDYRRQGLAARLIAAAEHHLEQAGIHIIAALVETDNPNSLALFQREGYHLHHDIVYLTKRADDTV